MIDIDELKKGLHLSIEPYMELSFDEICELDEDVARQGVWNLRAEVKRLREELRLTKEWLDQLYDEDLVSAFRFHVY